MSLVRNPLFGVFLLLLAAPSSIGSAPRKDQLLFQPAQGTEVSRELRFEATLNLEDVWASADGEELPAEAILGQLDEALVVRHTLTVSDVILRSAEGRLLELQRTYESASLEGGMESELDSADGADALVGSTVRFEWEEEEESYDISFVDEDGDASLLEGLDADMDLLNLLPEGDVSVGDRWTVPGEKLATIFLPGGSAGFPAEPEDDTFAPTLETLEAQMDALIEDLSIECEYEGVRQEGDVEVAVIKFVYEGDVTIDLSDFLGDILSEQEVPFDVEATLSVDIELDGRGQLLWNLGAHHAHDFEMEAELTLAAEGEASMDMDGESHAAEGTAEVYGELSWSLTTR
jgi:hypothetical protein